jgi:hypothetical protein
MQHALEVARRLAALPAIEMRRAVLRDLLAPLDADEAVRLCGELVRRGADGAPFDVAVLALGAILDAGDLSYDRHEELYAAALEAKDTALARMLLSAQPPPIGRPQRVLIPGRPEITLGERKSLARATPGKLPREVFERLLRDDDPSVVEILLANPRLTETDVVRIAARRPTTAELQRAVYRCERFVQRYPVKRALAFNPYTPSDVAARLVPMLTRRDARALAADPQVAETVRKLAQSLLR